MFFSFLFAFQEKPERFVFAVFPWDIAGGRCGGFPPYRRGTPTTRGRSLKKRGKNSMINIENSAFFDFCVKIANISDEVLLRYSASTGANES